MHYHCEIVIPPTDNIEKVIASVLAPFDENADEASNAFWDWWVIGGRWAGAKLMAQYDPEKINQFHEWLTTENITVSGIQFGKQELSPADQIQKVDAKWNEMFPSNPPIPCPIFNHSGKSLQGDVLPLKDVSERLTCSHVIFAAPSYVEGDWTGSPEAEFMLRESAWNGCNHMPVKWDGTFKSALKAYLKSLSRSAAAYAEKATPQENWLVVTVDYHS